VQENNGAPCANSSETPPDSDHYKGFDEILDETNVRIGTIYHNGIVERAGDDPLGPKADGFLTDIIPDQAALEKPHSTGFSGRSMDRRW
jgi:hypothetical protein